MNDPLEKKRVSEAVSQCHIPWRLEIIDSTISTNNDLIDAGKKGAPEGTLIIAENQSSGRGRMGRTWEASSGSALLFSLLLRPRWQPSENYKLGFITSLACAKALSNVTGEDFEIKWPNDILFQKKKVAGILIESIHKGSLLDFSVIGLGLNIHQKAENFSMEIRDKAVSLSMIQEGLHRNDILIELLKSFDETYSQEWDSIHQDWAQRCSSLGQMIKIQDQAQTWEGMLIEVDKKGVLHLRMESGQIKTFHSGEIL